MSKIVLVIEDDPLTCELYGAFFKHHGIDIVVVNTLADAVAQIYADRGGDIGCILLDGNVPKTEDGRPESTVPFARSLRENPLTKDIPLIACSAQGERIRELKETGCVAAFLKDGSQKVIEEAVRRIQKQ